MTRFSEKIVLEHGELHVAAYDPLDEDFDLNAQFDLIFSHTISGGLSGKLEAFMAFKELIKIFIDKYGDENKFLELDIEEKLALLTVTQEQIMALISKNLYGAVNGVSLFQVWLIALIRKDVTFSYDVLMKILNEAEKTDSVSGDRNGK